MEDYQCARRGKKRKITHFPSADMEGCSSTSAEAFDHYKPSPAHHQKRYHVFLSFVGVNVRKTLVDHLVESLFAAGFDVFLGNEESEKGENIEIIRNSTLHIPLFSADYASSSRCLDELSFMWTCKSTCTGTTIFPLFYNVEPSDLRYPDKKGPYVEAFHKHRKEGRSEKEMDAWKEALAEISLLSGWSLPETGGGYEDRLVKLFVMDLLKTLTINPLYVAKHPEGLSHRMEEVTRLLEINNHSRHVLGVGIWGMGGVGKTTLAKAIYNNIYSKFEASCFVSDVQAAAKESVKGLLNLQKQILQDLAKVVESKLSKLHSVDSGKVEMKDLLRSIKALVILDDVDDEEQLYALIGDGVNGYWFGGGSRIIITTRDSQVLTRQIHVIQYPMRGLDPKEGLKLFSWHAFMRTGPAEGYEDITEKIVDACQGLPLSLEVVGAHLYGEKSLEIWNEALTNLVKEHRKVYDTLKISYDALSPEEQRIFLDIACFFLGPLYPLYLPGIRYNMELYDKLWARYNMDFYVKLWEDLKCGSARTCLRNLERKCLIRIDEDRYYHRRYSIFWMHDHLRDLGRQIIKEESPNNPAHRSRMWCHEDLVSVAAQTQGMPNIEGLVWNLGDEEQGLHQTYSSIFPWALMQKMKFMFVSSLRQEGFTNLPPTLTVLGLWCSRFREDGSAAETQPISFNLPKTIGQLKFLRFLDISGSSKVHLPNEVGELRNLEELYLSHCDLIELPQSLGNLIKLKVLDVSYNHVNSFPANFHQLRSLAHIYAEENNAIKELSNLPSSVIELNLGGCSKLQEVSSISYLKKLEVLDVYRCTSLTELPSLDSMHSLKDLKLESCKELEELPALPDSLSCLNLSGCLKLQEVSNISHLKNLEVLDVSGCINITKLPSLDSMHSLKDLKLESCKELQELPALPDSLSHLRLHGCHKLQEVSSISQLKKLEVLDASWCTSLRKLPSLESMHSLKDLKLKSCKELEELPALPDSISCLNLSGCLELQEVSSISHLKKLEVLDVSWCTSLTELPSLDSMQSLEDLKLESCKELEELPALPDSLSCLNLSGCLELQEVLSISHLKKLEVLDVSGCISITKLPSLDSMHSLKDLELEHCVKLQELLALPDTFSYLSLRGCHKLQEVSSISRLKKLEVLNVSWCKSLTKLPFLNSMHFLKGLNIESCRELQELPALPDGLSCLSLSRCHKLQEVSSISHLKKLEVLDVSWCTSLTKLPLLDYMHSLKDLNLESCEELQELPALPDSLSCLSLSGCHKLLLSLNGCPKLQEASNISHLKKLEVLAVSCCKSLTKIPSLDFMHSLKNLKLESCEQLQELPSLPESLSRLSLCGCHKLQEVSSISHLKKLEVLDVSLCTSLTKLPSLESMHFLKKITLHNCDIWELPSLPESLVDLKVTNCYNLRKLPSLSHMIELKALDLSLCRKLTRLPQLSSMLSLIELKLDNCWNLEELPPLPKCINLSTKGVLRLGYASLLITTDRGKRKNPEPEDITALSLALANPKRLHVSEVNEEGTSTAQEYMDQDGQGKTSFPPPPVRNACGGGKSLISFKVFKLPNLSFVHPVSFKFLCHLDIRGTQLHRLPNEVGELLCIEELNLSDCSLRDLPRSFANLINLKVLCMSENHLRSFPVNFHQLKSLICLDASRNEGFEELPVLPEDLINVKVQYCSNLQKMCSVSHMRHLESLDFSYCRSIADLPELDSIHSLRELALEHCKELKKLPALPEGLISLKVGECPSLHKISSISRLRYLETLDLSYCRNIIELPDLSSMHSLRELTLDFCDKLEKLPTLPEGLVKVSWKESLKQHKMSRMFIMHPLRELKLENCYKLEELCSLPQNFIHVKVSDCYNLQDLSSISHMLKLETFELSQCRCIIQLPELNCIRSLRELTLDSCDKLEELPCLPEGLIHLKVKACVNLQKLSSMSQLMKLETLDLSSCIGLTQLPQLNCLGSLREVSLDNCENLKELPSLPEGLINLKVRGCYELQKVSHMSHMRNLETLDLSLCVSVTTLPELDGMHSLRELKVEHCESIEELPSLPEGLISLSLVHCHRLQKMSSMSHIRKLEVLDLSWCMSVTKLPELDAMNSLRDLTLEHCEELEELPSLPKSLCSVNLGSCCKLRKIIIVSEMTYLKTLQLPYCTNLTHISQLGLLKSLSEFTLEYCENLEELPCLPEGLMNLSLVGCNKLQKIQSISCMRLLKTFNLSSCISLIKLPKLDAMYSLTGFRVEHCENLEELPSLPVNLNNLSLVHCYKLQNISSMCHLRNLETVDLSWCINLSKLPKLNAMHSLRELKIEQCVKLEEFPSMPESVTNLNASRCYKLQKIDISNMRKLENLHLPYCTSLTEVSQLEFLEYLRKLTLDFCEELEELPALPSGLIHLSVRHCYKLERVYSMSHLRNLESLDLSSCISLTKLPEVHATYSLKELKIEQCVKLEEFPSLPESVTNLNANCCYKLQKIYMSNMRKLENLHLPYCTSLTEVSQLDLLEYLRKLTLDFCEELEELPALPDGLIHLSVRHCYKLERVYSMSHLRNLESLDLSSCVSLTKLPEVHAMYSLRELKIEHWENLEELPSLPEGLINLSLVSCYKLQMISSVSFVRNLEILDLSWCTSLTKLPNFDHMHSLRKLMLEHCELEELPSLPKGLNPKYY